MSGYSCVRRRAMRHGLCACVLAGAAVVNALVVGFASSARPRPIHAARRRTPLSYRQRNAVAEARSLVARFSCHAFFSAGYGGRVNSAERRTEHRVFHDDDDMNLVNDLTQTVFPATN